MTDRELLELAAKAAGVRPASYRGEKAGYYQPDLGKIGHWNPLTDDGDALRLAVKLRLELTVFRDHVTAFYATGWCDEPHGADANAATRRAIVRAVAEIGRAVA